MKRSVMTIAMTVLFLSMIAHPVAIADRLERERLIADCMEQLRVIGAAIEAYKADNQGEMPDWLSDLYPRYLQNPEILICAADKTGGSPAGYAEYKDPKMPCSYLYEFNPMKSAAGQLFDISPPKDLTCKERKTMQLKYFGGLVPVVRCRHHGMQVLNLGYDGKIRLSRAAWENTPEAISAFLSFFQSVIENNPDGWEEQLSLEKIYEYLNARRRLPDLRSILEKASNLSADALKILGEIYLSEGEIDKTTEIYHRLVRLASNDIESRSQLAKLYGLAKKYQAAQDQCQKIIQLDPDNSEAYALLAELDAITDGRRIQERFSNAPAGDPEMHYLAKLEEMLLVSKEDLKATVTKAYDIVGDSFGESTSVTRLGHLYGTLDKSFSETRGQWRTYSSSDGLVNDFVNAMGQDDRGILWIGTWAGVCQYDGQSFTRFLINEEFDNDVILSILIDRQEHIWFGSYLHGAFRYDGESFTHYTTENGLAGNDIREIIQDRNGSIWFACADGGLSRYDGKTFTNFTTEDGLAANEILAIMEGSRGVLWIGTSDGVSRYDGKAFTNLTEADGWVNNRVNAIVEDRDGNLWFGTDKGASRYDGEKFTSFTKNDGLTDQAISSILADQEANLWFAVAWWAAVGEGVFHYDGKTFINLTKQDGLAANHVNTIFEDREGNIWFGHHTANGLSKFNPRGLKNYGVQDGLAGTHAQRIAEDGEGNLWVSTDRGVCVYDGRTFRQPIAESNRVLGFVEAILADSRNNLWFGTRQYPFGRESVFNRERGIVRFDGTNYTRFTTLDGLAGNSIGHMIEDRNGNIWIAATSHGWGGGGAGISRYDGKDFTNFTMADGLGYDEVLYLSEDHQGNIWIATLGGISRYDGKGFTNFTTDDGLGSDFVFRIFTDSQGRIWIGTINGLSMYDGTSFSSPPQFTGKSIWAIIEDRDGHLWFGTSNSGVIKTDGNALTYITAADGLPHNDVSALKEDKDGNIWIGTHGGLTRYTPNPIPPLIHIESVVADRVYEDLTNISLPAETSYLKVNYRGISFRTRPEAMQYFYQLEGRDVGARHASPSQNQPSAGSTNWQGPTNDRSVDYLDMKPGKYTFKVKAVDMDLNYSEPASVSIVIPPPPFYRTGIFLLALSIIGGGSSLLAIFLAVHRLRSSRAERLRLQHELEDAHQMQLRLLPESAPLASGFDIAGSSRPAREVGGDFFDYLPLAGGKIGIALADVSGKGLKGAMNAVLANGMLHEVAKDGASCGEILSALNADLYPRIERQMFTALGLAILKQDTKKLQWANAAQPYPLVKRDEQVFEFKSDNELPLGMMPNVSYPDWDLELQSGDVVIFCTDGVIEAENEAEEMYGAERLEQVLAHINPTMNAEEIIEAILQNVADFVGTTEQYDDMTVVVVKKL